MTSSISLQSAGAISVLGGNYDSSANLLILDVAISNGLNQAPLLQKRIFEIHSITMQVPNQPSVELVSARVKESAVVINAIIEQLKQSESPFTQALFSKDNHGPLIKKITMGLQANGRALSGNMDIENSRLVFGNKTNSYLRELESKVNQVIQPQSIQQMFQLPQLGQWFQNAKSAQKNHQWDHSFSIALTPSEQSDQILKFLNQHFKNFCKHTYQLENKLQLLTPQMQAMHQLKIKIEHLLQVMDLTEENIQLLNDHLNQLRKSFAFFEALENKIALNKVMITELAHFLLVRNLYEQKISNSGDALVGASLTQDWENFIHKYHLVTTHHNDIEEHLQQSLALNITPEMLDQVVNIQDLTEACEQLEEGYDDSASFVSCESFLDDQDL